MEPLNLDGLQDGSLLLIDSPPIIYTLESHPKFAQRFAPMFEAQAKGQFEFAVTTVAIAEVLTGPLRTGDEALARRYRSVLESWQVVVLGAGVAEVTARLRATSGLKLADAVQAASAITIDAQALVTHDRDFSRLRSLRVIS